MLKEQRGRLKLNAFMEYSQKIRTSFLKFWKYIGVAICRQQDVNPTTLSQFLVIQILCN